MYFESFCTGSLSVSCLRSYADSKVTMTYSEEWCTRLSGPVEPEIGAFAGRFLLRLSATFKKRDMPPLLYIYMGCLVLGGTMVIIVLASGYSGTPHGLNAAARGTGKALLASLRRIVNLRNFAFFTAFFGLTGTILTFVEVPRVLTLIAAHAMGFFGSRVVGRLLTRVGKTESKGHQNDS